MIRGESCLGLWELIHPPSFTADHIVYCFFPIAGAIGSQEAALNIFTSRGKDMLKSPQFKVQNARLYGCDRLVAINAKDEHHNNGIFFPAEKFHDSS